MTDNLESDLAEGSAGQPNPAASQGNGDKPTSSFNASKLPEQLESLVTKAVEKAVQSTKDRRFSNIEKQLDDFKPVLEQVKSILTPEQLRQFNEIQKDAEFEQLKKMVYGNPSTSTSESGNQGRAANSEAQGVLLQVVDELLDLPANDSRVTQIKLDHGNDINAYKEAAKKLKQSLETGTPTPAEQPLPTGSAPRPPSVEENMNKYINEMKDARGKGNQFGNAIKEKYRKLGVPVDEITFRV